MSGINDAQLLDKLVRKIVDQKVNNIIKGNKMAGKIQAINGSKASVWINGSSEITSNIPIRFGLALKPNDEVWIERINFNDTDLEISSKRNINNETWNSGDSSWISINTLSNTWVWYGYPYSTVAYKKDTIGNLHFKGVVKNGSLGSSVFTLPSGYRPSEKRVLYNGGNRFDIDVNGMVFIMEGNPTMISFDGLDFQL